MSRAKPFIPTYVKVLQLLKLMKANPEIGIVRCRIKFPIISGYLPSSTMLNQIRFSPKTKKKVEIGLEMRVELFFDSIFELSDIDYGMPVQMIKTQAI